jgi:predicted nuclease with TOPRIM domain
MEEKIGYAVITIEDYKELVGDNVMLENQKNDLLDEVADLKDKYEELRGVIAKKIRAKENYHFKNVELKQEEVIEDYHYNCIKKEFYDYEMCDENYIKSVIIDYKLNQEEGEIDE